jgi:hypothetical protein
MSLLMTPMPAISMLAFKLSLLKEMNWIRRLQRYSTTTATVRQVPRAQAQAVAQAVALAMLQAMLQAMPTWATRAKIRFRVTYSWALVQDQEAVVVVVVAAVVEAVVEAEVKAVVEAVVVVVEEAVVEAVVEVVVQILTSRSMCLTALTSTSTMMLILSTNQ